MDPRAIRAHLAGTWPAAQALGTATLAFEDRFRRRFRLTDDSGRAFLLDLPRAVPLAEGDGLELEGGGYLAVHAAAEPLMEVRCAGLGGLARIAWHLGNRHLAIEIGEGVLRMRPDHVIAAMLRGLGAEVREIEAPFTPETGAYAGAGHAHEP